MKTIYKKSMQHNANNKYMIESKTALLECERLHKPLTIHTFSRRFITSYKCIDTPQKPITLNNFCIHGELIYYKPNHFEWRTISLDECELIETDNDKGISFFDLD